MRKASLFFFFWFMLAGAAAAAAEPITFGVFPYISRGQLVEQHDPLRQYLQQKLGRQVDFVTAPDFAEFLARTSHGDYDIVFTAPHLARFAERHDRYRRLARTRHNVQGIFLVRSDSAVHTLADLKGKSIMMAQPLSIVYQMANEQLRKQGLVDGRDITIVGTRTHNNALNGPGRGEADASVTGALLWLAADEATHSALRQVDVTVKAPGFMLMANKRLNPYQVARAKKALLEFERTPAGQEFFRQTGFEGFAAIDDRTMKAMDPYTRVLRDQLR